MFFRKLFIFYYFFFKDKKMKRNEIIDEMNVEKYIIHVILSITRKLYKEVF